MVAAYKMKKCDVCSLKFKPQSGNSVVCSSVCRDRNRLLKERKREHIKRWSSATEIKCSSCSVLFTTTDSKKKYCGSDACEYVRCSRKNKRADKKRLGKRTEYSDIRYNNVRDSILRQKKKSYRESKDYIVREGWTTAKIKFSEVKDKFESEGYRVTSKDYTNTSTKIDVICPKGHQWSVSYKAFNDTESYDGHRCPQCVRVEQRSRPESEIVTFIDKISPETEVVTSDRSILDGKEIDIYLPELKIGIEYCGLYWHGELSSGKERAYHRKKMDSCAEAGIRLITIFEDEYLNKKEVVLSRIESAVGVTSRKIFARKCEVREITSKQAATFMVENHLQGKCGTSARWGLFYKEELIQVLTLGSLTRKHSGNNCVELKRLASLRGVSVVGGASRLFKAAKRWAKENGYSHIKSYCDMRWAKGDHTVYDTLGFTLQAETKYSPHYIKNQVRYRNFSLRKTPEERLTGKTEWELRQEQGYDRIWDCGHRTYVFKV